MKQDRDGRDVQCTEKMQIYHNTTVKNGQKQPIMVSLGCHIRFVHLIRVIWQKRTNKLDEMRHIRVKESAAKTVVQEGK